MPQNRIIYAGILILVASALIYFGAWLAKAISWILPYTAGVALLMIIGGVFYEIKKREPASPPNS